MACVPGLGRRRVGGGIGDNGGYDGPGRGRGSGQLFGFIAAVFVLLIPAPAARAESDCSPASGHWFRHPLLVTQIPAQSQPEDLSPETAGAPRAPYGDGARILVLDAPSSPRVLTPGFHSAADPDVSFDGRRVLFAGKRTIADRWAIYEATVEGGTIRQVTKGLGDC